MIKPEIGQYMTDHYESPRYFCKNMKLLVVFNNRPIRVTVTEAFGDAAWVECADPKFIEMIGLYDGVVYTLSAFRERVTGHMKKKYGISWDDACGETAPLEEARFYQTPEEFASMWGDKYELTLLSDAGLA